MAATQLFVLKEIKDQRSKIKNTGQKLKIFTPLFILFLLIFSYLIFNSLVIASNKWVAVYKLIKILELTFLGWTIVRLKPRLATILFFLSIGVFYTSIIALGEFFFQRSIGGFFWWVGERTFYAGSPGIALTSIAGRLFLRPYSVFPHPNVFGGYLSVILPLILFSLLNMRFERNNYVFIWFLISLISGLIGLLLSFSRAAWCIGILGFVLVILAKLSEKRWLKWKKLFFKKSLMLITFYTLFFLSIIGPFFLARMTSFQESSIWERESLIQGAIRGISSSPLIGIGLNNSIVQQWRFLPYISELYIFQPVHNVYLLILTETGLVGFLILITFLTMATINSQKKHPILTIALALLIGLGFFDHYLFTLQQGQLLFTLFASLAFVPRNELN